MNGKILNFFNKNKLKKIFILFFLVIFSFVGFSGISNAKKEDYPGQTNIKVGDLRDSSNITDVNNALNEVKIGNKDYNANRTGEEGMKYLFENLAKTIKNIFYVLAGIYFLVEVLILFFSSNTEEEVSKFKKSIIWISIGIMVMQISYTFVSKLFDQDVNAGLAVRFSEGIIYPAIEILRFMASFLFLTMAIYAFYRYVTAHGEEESIKKGKYTIIQAIIGFFMVKVTETLVTYTYGKVWCATTGNNVPNLGKHPGTINPYNECILTPDPTGNIELVLKTINWVNGFVGLITLLFIFWAGALILFSNGDEEKYKKAKTIIIYIIVGILVLVTSYLIVNFFFDAQNQGLLK